MVKIPMIFTGDREIEVEKIGKVIPVKGKPFVEVFVPVEVAANLSRDRYWAFAKAEKPVQKKILTFEPPKEEKETPVTDEKPGEEKKGETGDKGGKKR